MPSSLLKDSKLFFTLALLSIIFLISDKFGFLNIPKSGLQYITSPIQYGLYKTSLNISRQFEFIIIARKASQENKALTEQLAQVLSENANLRRQLAEARGFLDQQKALNEETLTLVAARPLGMDRYLLIDKGLDDGIKINQAVVYKDNYIGKIKEVSPKRSSIMVSTDPDSRVSAFVNNQAGRAKGVLGGQFGSEMLLDKILHQEPIQKGDLVYSEGAEIEIPRGLVVGKVDQVFQRDNEIFKQAKVKPVFDPVDLDIVFVVAN